MVVLTIRSLWSRGKAPGCHLIVGLLGTRVGQDVLEQINIFCLYRTSKYDLPVIQPVLSTGCCQIKWCVENNCILSTVCSVCRADALDSAVRDTDVPCFVNSAVLKDVLLSTVRKKKARQVIDMETKRELRKPWSSPHAGRYCTLAELGEV